MTDRWSSLVCNLSWAEMTNTLHSVSLLCSLIQAPLHKWTVLADV